MYPTSTIRRGFTLIELLVVIAIIGILSAVVLAALSTARDKGKDAAIKANMDNARAQAHLYNDDSGSYTGLCDTTPTPVNNVPSINTMLVAAQTASGLGQPLNIDIATAGSWNVVTCHENGTDWAAEAPLKASASGSSDMWCVDSAGNGKEETGNLAASAVVCS